MTRATRNIRLYPWFRFFQNLIFWQAVWFLFFQDRLSASEAILLYAIYDLATTVLEVPSGYMSDRMGRRLTLITAALAGGLGSLLLGVGDGFAVFVLAQILLGAAAALASGTDSALLYESLEQAGRAGEVEDQELRAWRFSFIGLAVSAVTGGIMAVWWDRLPFLAAALAFAAALIVALAFSEPQHQPAARGWAAERARLRELRSALTRPVLLWLLVLSLLMYGYSHLPFVFGQPFIQQALSGSGIAAEAPLVSGLVSATMMVLSVLTSLVAPALRRMLGLGGILLAAFAIQILLAGALALSDSIFVIALLFLRMVPDSLSSPFILARIQPELADETRATYLSVKSLGGRLFFAATLWIAAGAVPGDAAMAHADIARVLGWYAAGGCIALGLLALAARRVPLEPKAAQKAPFQTGDPRL